MGLREYSDDRREKLLRHAVRAREKVGGLTNALEECRVAEAIVRRIDRTDDNLRAGCDY